VLHRIRPSGCGWINRHGSSGNLRPRRLAGRVVLLLKERALNFILDAQQPFFRAYCAITEVSGLDLKLSLAFLRGAKLR
jgi:hypothetical protein